MNMTKHARQRWSQRGIPQDTAQLIYLLGHSEPAPGGVECLSISRRDGQRLIQECHHLIVQTERAMKGTQLVLGNSKVITAKHPNGRSRKSR